MRDEATIAERNKKLNEVIGHGPDVAISWLRSAFHMHEEQRDDLLVKLHELRALYLAKVSGPLTVQEAQLLNVCRVCRGKVGGPFLLQYGAEFAHEGCVRRDQ